MSTELDTMKWVAHPARDRAGATTVAGMIIMAMAAAAVLFGQNWIWALPAIGFMVAAMNRFFFPSRFEMDSTGISAKYPLKDARFEWSQVRRLVVGEHGAYLSTRSRPTRFDRSGMEVLLPQYDRDAVITRLRAMVSGSEGSPASGEPA